MTGHMILLNLVGAIALLIWGTGMVRTGVLRTFGGAVRQALAVATRGQVRAAAAGVGAAAALQSSTATAMLLTGFVAGGLVGLAPALAVMLGADLGTTLVVQALAFDLSAVVPVLLVVGVAAALGAVSDRMRQTGRIIIGFGLMILALGLIVQASEPLRASPVMQLVLERLAADPILAVLFAAVLTWLFHSSVAFVLFVMSLAEAGVVGFPLAFALVIGANLGSGLVPLGLAARSPVTARRVLWGNLAFRALAVLAALAAMGPLVGAAGALDVGAGRQVAHVHTAFNLALIVVFLPLAGVAARVLMRLVPEPAGDASARQSRLDPALIERPALALTAATRELLSMADTVEMMLRRSIRAFEGAGEAEIAELRAMEEEVDSVQEEIKLYLVRLMRAELDREQSARVAELLLFTTNLEHVGDIIDKGLLRMAQKKRRLGLEFSQEGWRDLRAFHERVAEQLRLALSVLVARDPDLARELVVEKDRLRALEAEATERHLERLREGAAASIDTSALHLDILRDLKRVNAHLTTIAHPLLEERGELRGSRLKSDSKKKKAEAAVAELKGEIKGELKGR